MISRRTVLILAQTTLGLGLLIAWAWIVDIRSVARTLGRAQWQLVALGGGIAILSAFLRSVRWRQILKPVAMIPILEVWAIAVAASLINFLIPIRSGELARSLFLKQRHGVAISATLPTVAVDRSLDLLAVLVIGAAGAIAGLSLSKELSTALIVGGAILLTFTLFVALALAFGERMINLADRLLPRTLGLQNRGRILGVLQGLLSGFSAIGRKPRQLLPLIGISFVAVLLDSAVVYILFAGLGTLVPAILVLTGYALFALSFLVPGAPGYVGSMEAFGSLIFGALGVDGALAASAVVLFHALNATLLGLTGGAAIWALGLRPAAAFRSAIISADAVPVGLPEASSTKPNA